MSESLADHASRLLSPPQHLIDLAVEVSTWSPCRSKRGSVIFDGENVVAYGNNYKPDGFECDGSAECKATCRRFAIHAEQRALLSAGNAARGAEILHVKTINGQLVPSGGPSCEQCSKLALAAGVVAMWLYHEDGWRRYSAYDWHRLSLEAVAAPADGWTATPPERVPPWVQIQGGAELSNLVRIARTLTSPTGDFLHSHYEVEQLLWRWLLKWARPAANVADGWTAVRALSAEMRAEFTRGRDGLEYRLLIVEWVARLNALIPPEAGGT